MREVRRGLSGESDYAPADRSAAGDAGALHRLRSLPGGLSRTGKSVGNPGDRGADTAPFLMSRQKEK